MAAAVVEDFATVVLAAAAVGFGTAVVVVAAATAAVAEVVVEDPASPEMPVLVPKSMILTQEEEHQPIFLLSLGNGQSRQLSLIPVQLLPLERLG